MPKAAKKAVVRMWAILDRRGLLNSWPDLWPTKRQLIEDVGTQKDLDKFGERIVRVEVREL